ncbi:hypothetical protein [Chryseobacterium sp. Bi04]|uniref:hypothetical protein n=1 Tax=Chryseobacterium sp. Bi04 TaxID=2822345 RepID=UPI001D39BA71|nr:hypothetical protein [Chryseobacterium sp. Bi04]CAH0124036.1 hypothetical protein SRABI04_00053 [Chryseobacterium sp. Bi04]
MKNLLLLLFMAITTPLFAQSKLTYENGNFDFLKDQSDVNVQYKFENVTFQVDNYTEAQYLERRKTETLAKKGEDAWKEWSGNWNEHRESVFIQRFIEGLNAKSKKIKFGKDLKTKYTLLVETKWVYPGWSGGMIMQPAKLSTVVTFVETENPAKVIAKIQTDKIEGVGSKVDYGMEYGRISAAYEKTGKELAKEIKKTLK